MSTRESIVVTGPTVEAAIKKGLAQLGVGPSQVIVEVLDEPARGLFGIGARQARVRLQPLVPVQRSPEPDEPEVVAGVTAAHAEPDEPEVVAGVTAAHAEPDELEVVAGVTAAHAEPDEPEVVAGVTDEVSPSPETAQVTYDDDDFFDDEGNFSDGVEVLSQGMVVDDQPKPRPYFRRLSLVKPRTTTDDDDAKEVLPARVPGPVPGPVPMATVDTDTDDEAYADDDDEAYADDADEADDEAYGDEADDEAYGDDDDDEAYGDEADDEAYADDADEQPVPMVDRDKRGPARFENFERRGRRYGDPIEDDDDEEPVRVVRKAAPVPDLAEDVDVDDDDVDMDDEAAYMPASTASRRSFDDDAEGAGADYALAERTLAEMMEIMGLDMVVEVMAPGNAANSDQPYILNLRGDERTGAVLAGENGETLAALQFLTRLIVSKQTGDRANIVVDVNDHRLQRTDKLANLANRMADEAIATGRTVSMEPMPSHERRVVHMVLRRRGDVKTDSVGKGEKRRVTIVPKTNDVD